jgi:metallophosphoesterase (TIGR00282 family)
MVSGLTNRVVFGVYLPLSKRYGIEGSKVKILFIGDIFGKPGRKAVEVILPSLLEREKIDFCIANGENVAAGKGLTSILFKQLREFGVDVITSGNHIWHNKEIIPFIEKESRILRPINYPSSVPGRGWGIYDILHLKTKIAVISVMGRIFMRELDNPFNQIDAIVETIRQITPNIIIDIHAEATSEKIAFAWMLDGNVSAVIGTHTHIPTADEHIMPGGTAYITDSGMTGPYDSIIGVKKEIILEMFKTQMPVKHEVATGDIQFHSVLLEIDPENGRALSIRRLRFDVPE